MIRYSTNWMGPVNYDWVKEHGEGWCIGRIDVSGTDSDYPEELALPMMRAEDWGRFSDWLDTVETDFMWTLTQLVDQYEKTNPRITWWESLCGNE